jgi:hypothetical protein
MGFVSGYSGATAFEFHELPFLLHGFWLSKNCAHTTTSDSCVNSDSHRFSFTFPAIPDRVPP